MAKNKGAVHYIFEFLKLLFTLLFAIIKWIFLGLVWLARIVFSWLFSWLLKNGDSLKQTHIDSKRTTQNAAYTQLTEIDALNGRLDDFESLLYSNKSSIGLILGARGSGKSAIGMRILENAYAKNMRRVYAMGFDKKSLPIWIEHIESLDSVKNNSFVLVDEGGIQFSARSAMSDANKLLSQLLFISRHKDISVLFITQNCLPIDTWIKTPNGMKKLKDMKETDVVFSYDFKNNQVVPAISKKHSQSKQKIVKIYLQDGTILECSENHRWPIMNKNGLSYKIAKHLNADTDNILVVTGDG